MKNNRSVQRLLLYRSCLLEMQELGFDKVYSHNLGAEAGVSPEQVRKDFSNFRIKGNKKGGYEIDNLVVVMDKKLGKHKVENVILIGMGNLGKALVHYKGFVNRKINIVAAFDIDPSKQKKGDKIPVFPMEQMLQVVEAKEVSIAILAVPAVKAQSVCEDLLESGIKGILNFSPVVLKVNNGVKVSNVNLSNELEGLIYQVNYN